MSPISIPSVSPSVRLLALAACGAIATGSPSVNAQPINAQPTIEEPPAADLDLEEDLGEVESRPTEPNLLIPPAAEGTTTTYTDEEMSIDFPADWQVEMIENGLMIANVTTVESELVATQVVRMAAPPGPVVNANIDSFIDEGSAVGRYRTVDIDGQEALVMWLSERPDELTAAIATFIGYGNETILLFSRYAPDNETAEDDILRLHTSFTNLAADESIDTDVETDELN